MFRLLVALSCLSMTGALSVWAASAQSVAVLICVRFDPNPQADETQHLGWLKNICTFPIAVVHDLGRRTRGRPWALRRPSRRNRQARHSDWCRRPACGPDAGAPL